MRVLERRKVFHLKNKIVRKGIFLFILQLEFSGILGKLHCLNLEL